MSHHYIEVKDLYFRYPGSDEDVLNGLSFRVHHGEAVALVGANGAGKSTLLMLLSALFMPKSGTINVGGTISGPKTAREIQRNVGLVFQDPDDQLFMPSVYDDVAFGPMNMGLSPEEVEKVVLKSLAAVGALDIKDKPPYKLSGGQKRAVAISAILAMEPNVLILDEPSSNLDPWSRRQLIGLLNSFAHSRIIATHDLEMVLDVCPRVIILNKGQILADGPAKELLKDPSLLETARLEMPYSLKVRA